MTQEVQCTCPAARFGGTIHEDQCALTQAAYEVNNRMVAGAHPQAEQPLQASQRPNAAPVPPEQSPQSPQQQQPPPRPNPPPAPAGRNAPPPPPSFNDVGQGWVEVGSNIQTGEFTRIEFYPGTAPQVTQYNTDGSIAVLLTGQVQGVLLEVREVEGNSGTFKVAELEIDDPGKDWDKLVASFPCGVVDLKGSIPFIACGSYVQITRLPNEGQKKPFRVLTYQG